MDGGQKESENNKREITARRSTLNRTVKFMLILFGIWPGMPFVLVCRIFWIVTIGMILFCHYRYFLTHVRTVELLDLIDCMCSFLAHLKVIIKFSLLWVNQRKFVEIMMMMTEDWEDCAKSDVSRHETVCKAKISDRIMNSIVTLHTMTIVAYCTGAVIADVDVTNRTAELPYVNKLEIPLDVNTQITYRSILVAEFLHMIMCGWAAGVTNALLLTLTLHAAGQIDILRYWLTRLVPRADGNKHEAAVMMNKIVQKHQKIIYFSEAIESLYTYIALVQFASNTIMICSLGFLIVTAVGSSNAADQITRSLLFYTITNLEAFIFCFAGEYLSNKSKAISVESYNIEWYDLKPRDNRNLLFIILRSQKQLTLTAGKMMDLSLQSFASIMNASGSYLSVLLAMQ